MEKASAGMRSFCEDLVTGHENRKIGIKEMREQTQALRENARKFLTDSRKFHKKMGKNLRQNLEQGKKDLGKNVGAFIKEFRKKEKELKADLAEASRIWKGMCEDLKNWRTKSK
jgi:gas vesicle protein